MHGDSSTWISTSLGSRSHFSATVSLSQGQHGVIRPKIQALSTESYWTNGQIKPEFCAQRAIRRAIGSTQSFVYRERLDQLSQQVRALRTGVTRPVIRSNGLDE